jgi:catechol 2,3-dioxygenase-like lactoylglutathione lyase family enzyme
MSFAQTRGLWAVTQLFEEAEVSTTATRIAKVGPVVIPVADVDRAIEFYTDKLGFEKRVDVPFGGDYRWVEVAPPGADTTIALAPPAPNGEKAGGRETGICLNTADIDGVHAELRDKGVDVDAEISRMGDPVPAMFWLRDHEENVVLVVEADV